MVLTTPLQDVFICWRSLHPDAFLHMPPDGCE
jgi:hypothetical protein